MVTLFESTDAVQICFAQALLSDAAIGHIVLDTHMSVMEGSIGILPRRICIAATDLSRARQLLKAAGLIEAL